MAELTDLLALASFGEAQPRSGRDVARRRSAIVGVERKGCWYSLHKTF
eukprot:CAMPEP_0181473618 /NCGR_PEP_ID=MMETSP1110-20121109/40215_1 /TAXON_ID=174948 /ORGANISM="Symbiodinium sp., Strain CCMP421" /LENGTH=47 /DNA_ID= /DNA_START= /DNA_END= /DNA_ORIENTATION=